MDTHVPANTAAPAAPSADRVPHRWRNLLTLTGVTVVDNTEGSAINTIFPSIASALNLTSGNLGVMTALGKIASVPTGPAWMWLSGRVGRKATLVATTVSGGVFGILAGFSPNFGVLLVFNTLMVAAIIGGSPIANAVIADSFADEHRARAPGLFYASVNGIASFIGPAIALFTSHPSGWRYAMWTLGAISILAGLVVLVAFKDPGIGASERELQAVPTQVRTRVKVSPRQVASLFRIPTYTVMMVSRLLSGHLLLGIFGIVFLVSERGFSNATAALVLVPFGIGYVVGALGGGFLVGALDKVNPKFARPGLLQFAQFSFAVVAFFATQIDHGTGITVYCVFWFLMAVCQGLNVPVNRPLVTAVVLPELRGQAFAIWLSVFETIGWAVFSILAGQLAETYGIGEVFLWVLVGLMVVNGLLLTVLHFTYHRDVEKVTAELQRRRTAAVQA
jgi:predicted MFS family arabinose efflux permease